MGLVYTQVALLQKRATAEKRPEHRHNSGSVELAGYTRGEIKKRVRESHEFSAGEKAFLAYVADQDLGKFVFCVKTVQDALSFGVKRWVSTRKKLAKKGFVTQQMVPLQDGAHFWFFDITFEPLRSSVYDAPPKEGKGEPLYNARVIPPKEGINPLKHTPPPPDRGAGGNVYGGEEEDRRAAKPAPATKPLKPAPSPAPKGGGAVLHPPKGTETMDERNFSAAKEFFDWLGRNGILAVRLAAQRRKKSDGKRGAPLGFGQPGKQVAVGAPFRTASAADLAQSLLARLERMDKNRLELVTSAAECPQGLSKSILVDDLGPVGLRLVKSIWRGPGAILETSPDNFQAILIRPEPLGRGERKSITDQLVAAAKAAARAAGEPGKGADGSATGSNQFHRLPGSVNYKPELDEPFTCRIVEYFTGTGEGVQPVKAVAKAVPARRVPVRPGPVRPMRKRRWSTPADSMSVEAFRLAVEMMDSGADLAQVEAVLATPEWLRHHDVNDWPTRTAAAAQKFRERRLYGSDGGTRHA